MKHGALSLPTIMNHLCFLTRIVECKIASSQPVVSALIFDGWPDAFSHYFALFATYPMDEKCGYTKVLLGFLPIDDEESLE